ncbi:MAG: serine hydrolase domain-containing protein [Pseudomonadota bacterium]|nr:serine hydrolase domain-containing protein [Pseudomonadota bacterium]
MENVSGVPFEAYVDREILQPAGMTRSSFDTTLVPGHGASLGYRTGEVSRIYGIRDVPAAGLNTSAVDLARFLHVVFAGGRSNGSRIIGTGTLDQMLTVQNSDVVLDFDLHTGLGWMLSSLGDIDIRGAGTVAHHSGRTLAFNSQIIALPREQLGVVVLANSTEARQAVDTIATAVLTRALEAKTGRPPDEWPASTIRADSAIAPIEPGPYATLAGLVSVETQGDSIRADAFGRSFRLNPRSDGRYGLGYRVLGIVPVNLGELGDIGFSVRDVQSRRVLTAERHGREIYAGERIPDSRPIPESWILRTGSYRIADPGGDAPLLRDIRLAVVQGVLAIQYKTQFSAEMVITTPLVAISDDEAIVPGLGRGAGERISVVRTADGGALSYSGYLLIEEH